VRTNATYYFTGKFQIVNRLNWLRIEFFGKFGLPRRGESPAGNLSCESITQFSVLRGSLIFLLLKIDFGIIAG